MDPCSDAQHRIADLLVDGLADDEQQALDEHLAGCAACRTELDEMTALAVLVQEHGAHRPSIESESEPVVARARPAGRRARPLVLAVVGLIAVAPALVLRSAAPDPVEAALVGEADGTVTLHELDTGSASRSGSSGSTTWTTAPTRPGWSGPTDRR